MANVPVTTKDLQGIYKKIIDSRGKILAIGLVVLMFQFVLVSFRTDVYEPLTEYIFQDLFKDLVIRKEGKPPIKVGAFLRKTLLWLIAVFLITLAF